MRVLLISRAMVAASHRARLRELAKLKVRLTVMTPHRWEYQRFEPGTGDGYELLSAPARLAWPILGRLANHTFYYKEALPLVRRGDWDLVHIDDEPFNFVSYHIVKSLGMSGPPVIFTTWQNLMKRYPPPFCMFERRVFERASGAISGNAEALDVLRRRGFSKPATVIPVHGVDPLIYRKHDATSLRRNMGLNGEFAVGFVGRLSPEKDLGTFIKALSLLPSECVLVLVGSGPERSRLDGMVKSLGLSGRVRWVPWVASDDVPKYMNALDVLVLPSRTCKYIKEQFGRVLIEAMACETCVVGSDSGEIPNVIGDAGLIFHEGDERELADRLLMLMESSSLREALRQNGLMRVHERFTHEKVAHDTARFYRQLCRT